MRLEEMLEIARPSPTGFTERSEETPVDLADLSALSTECRDNAGIGLVRAGKAPLHVRSGGYVRSSAERPPETSLVGSHPNVR